MLIFFSNAALSKDYYFITGINNNKIETGVITVSTASLDDEDIIESVLSLKLNYDRILNKAAYIEKINTLYKQKISQNYKDK